jgi:outer membrane protein assembly factor BamB
VLAKARPDLVFACYGMNDGIYLPFEDGRFAKFQAGILELRTAVAAAGARLIHLTPPPFDEVRGGHPGYGAALGRYADWLLAQRAAGWEVVDVQGPMQRFLTEQRRRDTNFFLAADGVHCGETGQWLIAQQLLLHLGARDAADAADATALVAGHPRGADILKLVQQKQRLLKDAWLTDVGHLRPGMNRGLPLAEAQSRAAEIESQIRTLAAAGRAADWPGWRGPARDGHVPAGAAMPDRLPREPRVVWRLKIGEGLASPVVAGGKVFYLDNQSDRETVHALDSQTGRELWQATLDDVFRDSQYAPGPRCTPLVDGDRLYAQSSKGLLRCLNVADGRQLWSLNYTQDFGAVFIGERGLAQGAHRHGYTGSPCVDGARLIVTVGDTNGAGIVCLDKHTGRVLWKSQNDRAGNAAPITAQIGGVGPRQVVAFTVEGLIGLNLENGELLWRVPMTSTYGRHAATPVVVGNMVVAGSHMRGTVGVEVTVDAAGQWQPRVKWESKEATLNFASPVAVGGQVYGLGPTKNVFCLEAGTGKVNWSKTGLISTSAEKAHAAFLVAGGAVLMLTDTGELIQFAADPREFRELGRAQVCGANWCNPACADGRLFVRDARELLCVDLRP